jgi:hypothetical protein
VTRVQMFTEEGMPAGEQEVPEDVYAAAGLVRSWMEARGFDGLDGLSRKPNHKMPPPPQRKYLPTLADLLDRLSIVLMKEVFIKDHREDYRREQETIMDDIDLILSEKPPLRAVQIRALCVLQLANRYIWERESTIRDDSSNESAEVQLGHLRATHSVNGVRNTAKNVISAFDNSRLDYKIDALAAELPPEHGNWRVFDK